MKRAELVVGQEYWYSRSVSRWQESLGEGCKVTIVDVGYWEEPKGHWTRDYSPRKTSSGMGVLVDMEKKSWSGGETKVVRVVASVSHIRGPYEETFKAVTERTEAIRAKTREDSDRKKAENIITTAAIELAKQNGIKATANYFGTTEVTISAADLTMLIEASIREQ